MTLTGSSDPLYPSKLRQNTSLLLDFFHHFSTVSHPSSMRLHPFFWRKISLSITSRW